MLPFTMHKDPVFNERLGSNLETLNNCINSRFQGLTPSFFTSNIIVRPRIGPMPVMV